MRLDRDYYDVLGVARGASEDEIKRAFRELARTLHPDVAAAAPAGRFEEVVAAYRVLSHPRRRRLYDLLGLGAGRRSSAAAPVELALEWWEAERGASKPLVFQETATCPDCRGRGAANGATPATCVACRGSGRVSRVTETAVARLLEVQPCRDCGGRGRAAVLACAACGGAGRRTLPTTSRVRIPAGVRDGDVLRVDGVPQRFRLRVSPRPRDSRLVLLVASLALAAALALLLYLVLVR